MKAALALLLALPLAAQIATENLPLRLEAPHTAEDYQWFLGGRPIPGATNQVLEIPSAQEADAGTYRVESSTGHSALFKVRFQRNVRVQVNGVDVRGDRVGIKGPSQIRLSSPLGPLPIRYTLDGTEPTAASQLYRTPILVTNACLLRAAIVIPEGDSIQIMR
jgi:hypothetical protein